MFNIRPTKIEGCYEIEPLVYHDNRGDFIKIYHEEEFKKEGLCSHYEEHYISLSRKGVIRGMHFQSPPNEHIKLVSCIEGKLLDVVLDIRKESTTYGQFYSTELNSQKRNMLYVPAGLAHGFYSYSENAIFMSLNSKKFASESDAGINWNSFGFKWPDPAPILSEKDKSQLNFNSYKSPF